MSRVRLYSPIRFAVAESSLRPLVLSTAASSSLLLLVNSWLALLAPAVCTIAIRSFAPRRRSMNCFAAIFTRGDRPKRVCRSSITIT